MKNLINKVLVVLVVSVVSLPIIAVQRFTSTPITKQQTKAATHEHLEQQAESMDFFQKIQNQRITDSFDVYTEQDRQKDIAALGNKATKNIKVFLLGSDKADGSSKKYRDKYREAALKDLANELIQDQTTTVVVTNTSAKSNPTTKNIECAKQEAGILACMTAAVDPYLRDSVRSAAITAIGKAAIYAGSCHIDKTIESTYGETIRNITPKKSMTADMNNNMNTNRNNMYMDYSQPKVIEPTNDLEEDIIETDIVTEEAPSQVPASRKSWWGNKQ